MTTTLKKLGESNPGAATVTDLYTVPAATQTVVSVIYAANRSATATSIRLSVAVAGAADAVVQYFVYDVQIGANETIEVGRGITLGATDKLRCYATLATVSFSAFGQENS